MSFNLLGVRVKLSFFLLTLLALFSFLDKSNLIILAILSSFIHELGHIVAAHLLGCGVKQIDFTPCGIKMILAKPLSLVNTYKKIVVLSAGCAVNLILFTIFLAFNQKNIALINLSIAIFNLIPVTTLDGGRILRELLGLTFDDRTSDTISDGISLVFSAILFILGSVVLIYSGYNFSLILTSIYLAITVIMRQKKLN